MARRLWCAALVLLSLFSPDRAPGAEGDSAQGAVARIRARGELRVAMAGEDYPPFFFVEPESGELRGFDVDLAREIASKMGVACAIDRSADSWNAVVDLVASGRDDIGLSCLSVTLPRAEQVYFTRPYVVMRQALLVNRVDLARQGIPLAAVKDLDRPSVSFAVRQGTSYATYVAQAFPQAQIVDTESFTLSFDAVLHGRATAVLTDEAEVKLMLYRQPEAALTLRPWVIDSFQDPIGIAVSQQAPELLHWLNVCLDLRGDPPSINELFARYLDLEKLAGSRGAALAAIDWQGGAEEKRCEGVSNGFAPSGLLVVLAATACLGVAFIAVFRKGR